MVSAFPYLDPSALCEPLAHSSQLLIPEGSASLSTHSPVEGPLVIPSSLVALYLQKEWLGHMLGVHLALKTNYPVLFQSGCTLCS